jgi:hypothetical protein
VDPFIQLGAQELGVPVAREVPRQQRDRRPVRRGVVRDRGLEAEQLVLDGLGGHLLDPRLHTGAEAAVHLDVDVVPVLDVLRAGSIEPDRAHEYVVLVRQLAEDLGQTPRGKAQREFQLEEPFTRRHEPLREPQVVE